MCSREWINRRIPSFCSNNEFIIFLFFQRYFRDTTRRLLWLCAIRVRFNCLLMSLASIYFISTVLLINIECCMVYVWPTVGVRCYVWVAAVVCTNWKRNINKWMNDNNNSLESRLTRTVSARAFVKFERRVAQFEVSILTGPTKRLKRLMACIFR